MSWRKSQQRLWEAKYQPRKKKLGRVVILIVIAFVVTATFLWNRLWPQLQKTGETVVREQFSFRQPQTLKELLTMPATRLERCDIGLINLLCAEGLPGAEDLKTEECLKTLDGWAEQVKFETQRHAYRFNEHPEQFRNSLGYFRMMILGTVLARDLGIRYNPDLALPQRDGQRPTMIMAF